MQKLGNHKNYHVEEINNIENQADIFDIFENPHPDMDYVIRSETAEFTAICPITGQPDFGKIIIETTPDKYCIELKSLKMYLLSFRNRGIFHEAVTGKIAKDIIDTIKPKWLKVTGEFSVRGGISTTVVFEYPQK
jgi:7-cyano-7-deazaguanine reductase